MADLAQNQPGLEKPTGMQKPKDEPIIHVIPEKFYGAALKKVMPKAKAEVAAPKAPSTPVPPGQTLPVIPKKKSKMPIIIAAAVVVVLAGGGVAAMLLLRKPAKPAGPICGDKKCDSGESTATCPVDCPAPSPVCGNGTCDAGETTATCSVDCPAPVPVCGDKKCDSGETTATCPVDCPAPAPVCGNGTCDAGETTATCPADCKPVAAVPGPDADSDGLTDIEETSIYQTNPHLADSDGDSYVDLNEVLNLYDPNNTKPSPLSANTGITVFSDAVLGYQIYRPTAWIMGAGPQGQTRFSAPTGEFVDILAEDLAKGDSLLDWYMALDPKATADGTKIQKTRQGYELIVGPNGMTDFVRAGDRVFIITYDLNGSGFIQYRATFQMMTNSFQLLPPPKK